MGCRAQPVRYPISRTVQQMTRETRMGQPSYTEFRILPCPLRFLHLSWYRTQLSKRGHLARAENYDLVVAVNFLTTLVALLCLKAHGRNWACIQTLQRNRITGDVTVAKLALVYTAQGAVDFRH